MQPAELWNRTAGIWLIAYVVDGLKKDRIKPILDLAMIRFKAFEKIRIERDQATQALDERKIVDRAKGLLMKTKNVSEADAFAMLRTAAMNQNKRLAELAEANVAAADMPREPKHG